MGSCVSTQVESTDSGSLVLIPNVAGERFWKQDENRYKTINSNCAPFISSIGEICVPINTFNGQVSNTLPKWISNHITTENYQLFISEINKKTIPAVQNMLKLVKESAYAKGGMYDFGKAGKAQDLMIAKNNEISLHWVNLRKELENILYELNNNILYKCNLIAKTSFNNVRLEQPTHITNKENISLHNAMEVSKEGQVLNTQELNS